MHHVSSDLRSHLLYQSSWFENYTAKMFYSMLHNTEMSLNDAVNDGAVCDVIPHIRSLSAAPSKSTSSLFAVKFLGFSDTFSHFMKCWTVGIMSRHVGFNFNNNRLLTDYK